MPTTSWNGISYPNNSDAETWAANYSNIASKAGLNGIPVYATTAARDAANPSPVLGQTCYVTADQLHYIRSIDPGPGGGGVAVAWHAVRPSVTQVFPAESRTNTTTFTNSTVALPLKANKRYRFELVMAVRGDSTVGIKFQLVVPAGATGRYFVRAPSTVTTRDNMTVGHYSKATFASGLGVGLAPDSLGVEVKVWGIINTAGTAGNLQLQLAQTVASALTSFMDIAILTMIEVG